MLRQLDHQGDHHDGQEAEKEHQSQPVRPSPAGLGFLQRQQRRHRGDGERDENDLHGLPEVERLDEQDRQDGHDDEHGQQRAEQKTAPAQQVEQVVGRGAEPEPEHGAEDGDLEGKGEKLLRVHGLALSGAQAGRGPPCNARFTAASSASDGNGLTR